MAPYIWMMCGCFCTAWMGQCTHLLGDTADWRVIALVRCGLALVFAIGLTRMSDAQLVVGGSVALWVRGCASSMSLLCTFYALTRLAPSVVMTLTNTLPIWVAFLSWPVLGTRPTLAVWLAAGCGVAGVVLIQSSHFTANPETAWTMSEATGAIVLSLTAALTSAIAMLGLHKVRNIHPLAIVVHYSGVATLFVLGTWFIGPFPDLTPLLQGKTLLILTAVGVSATLGQVCVTQAFTMGDPSRVSIAGLTQVLFALVLGLIFDGLAMELRTLCGIALILAPTAWMMAGKNAKQSAAARADAVRLASLTIHNETMETVNEPVSAYRRIEEPVAAR